VRNTLHSWQESPLCLFLFSEHEYSTLMIAKRESLFQMYVFKHRETRKFIQIIRIVRMWYSCLNLIVALLWAPPCYINLLKPTGNFMYHKVFNIQKFYVVMTWDVCVLYGFRNEQEILPHRIQGVRKRLYPFLFCFSLGAQCVESGVSCTDCY